MEKYANKIMVHLTVEIVQPETVLLMHLFVMGRIVAYVELHQFRQSIQRYITLVPQKIQQEYLAVENLEKEQVTRVFQHH